MRDEVLLNDKTDSFDAHGLILVSALRHSFTVIYDVSIVKII